MLKTQEKIINGLLIKQLNQSIDESGKIMRMLKADDPYFENFGEINFSVVFPQRIKGWFIHQRITVNCAVITGNIKLVLFDQREFSSTNGMIQEIFLGPDSYKLVKIPPMIWYGYKNIGAESSIFANCITLPDGERETQTVDPFSDHIPYKFDSNIQ